MKKVAVAAVVVLALVLFVSGSREPVTITLAAENAELITDGALVLEGDADAGYNVGWWETINDEVSWDIEVESAGRYTVSIYYSCDPQFPGSTVAVSAGNEMVAGTIRDTSAWDSYITQELGTIQLEAGMQTITIRATSVANRFVCNLRRIALEK
jgi:hypothetical protein